MPIITDPLRGRVRPTPSHSDEEIVRALGGPRDWTVLTGAGLSTDSGIPDYRGPAAPPRRPMTVQTFLSGPAQRSRYWARSWLGWSHMDMARPNAGHRALARLQPHGIITQNVDGLHEDAGSAPVIDLHGRLNRVICLQCGELYDRDLVQAHLTRLNPDFLTDLEVDPADIETAPDGDVDLEATAGFRVWDCPACGGLLKPDVVYFGESVPAVRTQAAFDLVDSASGLLVMGTSLAVMSGLRFVKHARKHGKPVVIVTDGPTRGDEYADYRSVTRVGDFLAAWERALLGGTATVPGGVVSGGVPTAAV